ncbi:MAG: type II toxin-antitoxin system RelE/ParE family toxin [Bacteroidota bacterium]
MVKVRKVIWSRKAKHSLKQHCDFIKNDSPSAAKRVRHEILSTTRNLGSMPNKFQVDELYPGNPGNIRRFFKWSYRVVYEVTDNTIIILNVFHTSQEPSKP